MSTQALSMASQPYYPNGQQNGGQNGGRGSYSYHYYYQGNFGAHALVNWARRGGQGHVQFARTRQEYGQNLKGYADTYLNMLDTDGDKETVNVNELLNAVGGDQRKAMALMLVADTNRDGKLQRTELEKMLFEIDKVDGQLGVFGPQDTDKTVQYIEQKLAQRGMNLDQAVQRVYGQSGLPGAQNGNQFQLPGSPGANGATGASGIPGMDLNGQSPLGGPNGTDPFGQKPPGGDQFNKPGGTNDPLGLGAPPPGGDQLGKPGGANDPLGQGAPNNGLGNPFGDQLGPQDPAGQETIDGPRRRRDRDDCCCPKEKKKEPSAGEQMMMCMMAYMMGEMLGDCMKPKNNDMEALALLALL